MLERQKGPLCRRREAQAVPPARYVRLPVGGGWFVDPVEVFVVHFPIRYRGQASGTIAHPWIMIR